MISYSKCLSGCFVTVKILDCVACYQFTNKLHYMCKSTKKAVKSTNTAENVTLTSTPITVQWMMDVSIKLI